MQWSIWILLYLAQKKYSSDFSAKQDDNSAAVTRETKTEGINKRLSLHHSILLFLKRHARSAHWSKWRGPPLRYVPTREHTREAAPTPTPACDQCQSPRTQVHTNPPQDASSA